MFEDGSAVVFVGIANVEIPLGTRWQFQEGMVSAEVYRTRRPARVEEVDWSSIEDPVGAASRRLGTRSTVGSPIVVEGGLWGAMIVSSSDDLLPPTPSSVSRTSQSSSGLRSPTLSQAEFAHSSPRNRRPCAGSRHWSQRAVRQPLSSQPSPGIAHVFSDVAPSLVATVVRFDPGPECVLVGAAPDEREPIGTRWPPHDLHVSTRVLRTGRSARRDKEKLDATNGPGRGRDVAARFVYQIGSPPVIVDGRLWGAMTLNATDPLPADIDQRLPSFVQLIATAIANATTIQA